MSRPRSLLHICCAPDASWVVRLLRQDYEVAGLFYNPNIEPQQEYELRRGEVERLARRYRLPLYVGEYDPKSWRRAVFGLELEPEGGKRCEVCFRIRLERTAQFAKAKGYDCFTTTLSISPHKRADTVNQIGRLLARNYGIKFLAADFKHQDGFKRSVELSRRMGLYRQDYCGCLYSKQHRDAWRDREFLLLVDKVRRCRMCRLPEGSYPIFEGRPDAQFLLVGQAPGRYELKTGRPFSGPAGRRLFGWFREIGIGEEKVRERFYITAITRCYPGPAVHGKGDEPPSLEMLKNCKRYLDMEVKLLRPRIIVPVGRLAIHHFLGRQRLERIVGRRFRRLSYGWRPLIIPLPHPSGVNVWSFRPENRARIGRALRLLKAELEREG